MAQDEGVMIALAETAIYNCLDSFKGLKPEAKALVLTYAIASVYLDAGVSVEVALVSASRALKLIMKSEAARHVVAQRARERRAARRKARKAKRKT